MRFMIIISMIAVAALAVVNSAAPSTTAEDTSIDMGNLYFCSPAFEDSICETSIVAGDSVTWLNVDGAHRVTQCEIGFAVCPTSGGFDSGFLSQGQTFQQSFPSPGTIEYLCLFHPGNMRGRIVVAAAQTPTPTPVPTPGPSSSGTISPAVTAAGQNGAPTAAPGAIPAGGGAPMADRSDSLAWIALLTGGAMFIAAGAAATATARRHRD